LAKKLRAALASRGRLTPTPPRRLGAPKDRRTGGAWSACARCCFRAARFVHSH